MSECSLNDLRSFPVLLVVSICGLQKFAGPTEEPWRGEGTEGSAMLKPAMMKGHTLLQCEEAQCENA